MVNEKPVSLHPLTFDEVLDKLVKRKDSQAAESGSTKSTASRSPAKAKRRTGPRRKSSGG